MGKGSGGTSSAGDQEHRSKKHTEAELSGQVRRTKISSLSYRDMIFPSYTARLQLLSCEILFTLILLGY